MRSSRFIRMQNIIRGRRRMIIRRFMSGCWSTGGRKSRRAVERQNSRTEMVHRRERRPYYRFAAKDRENGPAEEHASGQRQSVGGHSAVLLLICSAVLE